MRTPDGTLRLAILQFSMHWQNAAKNIEVVEQWISHLDQPVDVIILPEMWSTGFTMSPESVAETMNDATVSWMVDTSKRLKKAICGSVVIQDGDQYFNRFIWSDPSDELLTYDKKHLFTLAKEHHHYTPGREKRVIEFLDWKICPLICYDLRFPEWSRNSLHYDLLLYVASFPAKRTYAWDQLLIARAIENQSYVVGCNRVGIDGNDIAYDGHSAVIDYTGRLLQPVHDQAGWIYQTIALQPQQVFRRAYPFLKDADLDI